MVERLVDPWEMQLRNRNFAGAKSFDDMGKVIYQDLSQGLVIRQGQIFECPTQKGDTNLIVALAARNGFMYYAHGDRGKKTRLDGFVNAVLYGDIQPRKAKEIDTERLTMSTIGIDAIANRRTGEEQIEYYGDGAEERFRRGS